MLGLLVLLTNVLQEFVVTLGLAVLNPMALNPQVTAILIFAKEQKGRLTPVMLKQ